MKRYMTKRDLAILGGVTTAVVAAAALLLVALYGPEGAVRQITGRARSGPTPSPVAVASGAPASTGGSGPSYSHCPGSAPATQADFRLLIPKLHVDAHTESLGVDAQGNLGTPSSKFCDVGWFTGGPKPGAPGDAVMDGHLDWNGIPAVFWHLGDLQPGDEVIIHRDGAVLHFRITSVSRVPYNAHPTGLFTNQGPPRLSLITCGGSWDAKRATYLQRLIVQAAYVNRTA